MYEQARDFAGMEVHILPDAEIASPATAEVPEECDRGRAIEPRKRSPWPGDRLDARKGLRPPRRLASYGVALVPKHNDL